MKNSPKAIFQLRRRWNIALFSGVFGRTLGAILLLGGGIVVIGKSMGYNWAAPILIFSAILSILVTWIQLKNRYVNNEQIAILLDLKSGGTGKVLQEINEGKNVAKWSTQSRPRAALKPILSTFIPGFIFFSLALIAPLDVINAKQGNLVNDQQLEKLQEFATTLEETIVLDKEVQAEVKNRMDLLQSEDARNTPNQGVMREALDRMESRLEEIAKESATQLETIRRAVEQSAQDSTADNAEKTFQKMADLAKEMQKMGFELEDFLTPEMLASLKNALTPEMLQALDIQKLAQLMSEATLQKLKDLAEQGLVKSSLLEEMAKQITSQAELTPGGT